MHEKYDALKELILRDALRRGNFVLSSGKKSDLYVDLRMVTLNPEGAYLIGSIIFDIIRDREVDAVGGMTLGADPIAVATSLVAFSAGRHLYSFIVRKEQKKHGTQRWIEGPVKPGHRVVIVEDVITTGASTEKAIDRVVDEGLVVDMVVAVFDRMEGGRARIEGLGYKIETLYDRLSI
ncbi:MAG: orotate phosphoribosyltransferase [Deltaproteobacteria bacterium]|nr:orotate phosphoribosyltransferase [Deltaproteobacteria bacterium]